jgi:hypothetical protein
MLRFIIELVPGGRRELRRTIASMHIGNQSDLADISNYKVDAVASANPVTAKPACSATCTVLGHDPTSIGVESNCESRVGNSAGRV